MSKIVVTGASGFIGSQTIVQLLNDGHEVKGTMRDLKRANSMRAIYSKHVQDLSTLSFAELDLLDDNGWEEAFDGMDYVIHTASPVPSQIPNDENDIIQPAVQGALRALKAASKAKVKRLVMTSSIVAIMYGHEDAKVNFTETDWSNPFHEKDKSAYSKSKTFAEKAAWEFIHQDESGLELTTINPGMVLGPVMESDFGTSAIVVKKLLDGAFPGTPKIGWPIVDVRDVAKLHIMALTHPKAGGERFMAANEFMWMNDIAHILKSKKPELSRKVATRNLPTWLMRILANFDKEVKSVAFELNKVRVNSSPKAKEMLGWQPRTNEEAIVATAETLVEFGGVKL